MAVGFNILFLWQKMFRKRKSLTTAQFYSSPELMKLLEAEIERQTPRVYFGHKSSFTRWITGWKCPPIKAQRTGQFEVV